MDCVMLSRLFGSRTGRPGGWNKTDRLWEQSWISLRGPAATEQRSTRQNQLASRLRCVTHPRASRSGVKTVGPPNAGRSRRQSDQRASPLRVFARTPLEGLGSSTTSHLPLLRARTHRHRANTPWEVLRPSSVDCGFMWRKSGGVICRMRVAAPKPADGGGIDVKETSSTSDPPSSLLDHVDDLDLPLV